MRHSISALTLFVIFPMLFGACTKHPGGGQTAARERLNPEQQVERFIRLSAGASSAADQGRLVDMCQGKLRQAFEKMSPENFQMTYLSGGVGIESFKIVSAKTDGVDAVIHYQVNIHNKQGVEPTQEVNEREVSLVQVDGYWFLDSIRPVGKDQIAFVNGMIF